jgi:hypothetical protein
MCENEREALLLKESLRWLVEEQKRRNEEIEALKKEYLLLSDPVAYYRLREEESYDSSFARAA